MAFTDFLNTSITAYAYVSADKYSKPTYASTGTSYDARVKTNNKVITSVLGEDITPDIKISIEGDASINPEDKLVIGSDIYEINRIYKPTGVKTVHHTSIYATKVG